MDSGHVSPVLAKVLTSESLMSLSPLVLLHKRFGGLSRSASPRWSKFGRILTERGRLWSNLFKLGSGFAALGPNLVAGQRWAIPGRSRPKPGQRWSNLSQIWPRLAEFGPHLLESRPELDDSGPTLAQCGSFRPTSQAAALGAALEHLPGNCSATFGRPWSPLAASEQAFRRTETVGTDGSGMKSGGGIRACRKSGVRR